MGIVATSTYLSDKEIFLSVEEVARLLKIDRKTVLQLYHDGELPGKRLGKKIIRFRKDLVLSSFESQGHAIVPLEAPDGD